MSSESDENRPPSSAVLNARRRWIPLRGMEGTPEPSRLSTAPRSDGSAAPDVDWLIVGGGIQGTYLSHYLIGALGTEPDRVRILDPHRRLLETWLRNTRNVGMVYLRSAAVHHLDLASLSLKRFGGESDCSPGGDVRPCTIAPYGRPLLSLFNRHAEKVIGENRLDRLHLQGRAEEMRAIGTGYEVRYATNKGRRKIAAGRVVLAIGTDDATCWPKWAVALRSAGMRVQHVLDPDFRRESLRPWRRAIVYGGGLSGAQISAALASRAPGTVTLVAGHEMEVHLFDSEPSWQGANFMASFAAEREPVRRREIIARERHRGSLTPEAKKELNALQDAGALSLATVDPATLSARATSGSTFVLSAEGADFEADLLVLATGYDMKRPGGEWLNAAIDRMSLPCAPCGYPLVSPNLEWRPGLFVSGPLAELELGPVARNISGAHRAAARLDYFVRSTGQE